MNIFVLDKDPVIAAQYHADQHLHKMILESAQMLSTWAYNAFPKVRQYIYKPTHPNHPCTLWLKDHSDNRIYLILLARELNNLRQTVDHSSMEVIEAIQDCIGHDDFPQLYSTPEKFVFAGPPSIEIRNLSIPEKYKMYYRQKHKQWLIQKGKGMTYKNRPIPPFMADLISPNGT